MLLLSILASDFPLLAWSRRSNLKRGLNRLKNVFQDEGKFCQIPGIRQRDAGFYVVTQMEFITYLPALDLRGRALRLNDFRTEGLALSLVFGG